MSHYETLGVARNANEVNIRKAYKAKALEHHPNKGGKEENFKSLGAAYEVLSDPVLRAEYDAIISPPKKSKKTKTASRSAGGGGGGGAGGGGGGAAPLSEANAELLQHIDNARHTVVYNTKDTLEALLEEARRRGLNYRTRYIKAKNVLNLLSKKPKGSRRTRKL